MPWRRECTCVLRPLTVLHLHRISDVTMLNSVHNGETPVGNGHFRPKALLLERLGPMTAAILNACAKMAPKNGFTVINDTILSATCRILVGMHVAAVDCPKKVMTLKCLACAVDTLTVCFRIRMDLVK